MDLRKWTGLVALVAVLSIALPALGQEAGHVAPGADPPAQASGAQAVKRDSGIGYRSLFDLTKSGGPLMIPIAACSFVLLVFCFERAISLRRSRVIPGPFTKRLLEQTRSGQLDRDQAIELCQANPSPVAEIFVGALKKWGRPAVEVEQAIIDSGERVANGLRKYLRIFNAIYTISPMLGLLGTVFGMITSFNSIAEAHAMGNPELLAAGIGHALLTTAAGLTVAIPALCLYLYFLSRVDRLIMDMDALGQQLVEAIAADRMIERPKAPRAPRREAAA